MRSFYLLGFDPIHVTISATIEVGEASIEFAGLSQGLSRDARARVRAALTTSGVNLDNKRVGVRIEPPVRGRNADTINLAIALEIAAALGKFERHDTPVIGDLSLSGGVRSVRGVYAILKAIPDGRAIVPYASSAEAARASNHAVAVDSLGLAMSGRATKCEAGRVVRHTLDLSEMRGQAQAKRALKIAAAGRHNVLITAQSGLAAQPLARRLTTIMPMMTEREIDDLTTTYSMAGLLPECGVMVDRPYRSPWFTTSLPGLIDFTSWCVPGEVFLARHGVLALSELQEWRGSTLVEVLKKVGEVEREFGQAPIVVGIQEPCPCGQAGNPGGRGCVCGPERIAKHLQAVPKEVVDAFDLHVTLTPNDWRDVGETSDVIRPHVDAARALISQAPNSGVSSVARTIAALEGNATVLPRHIEEAATFTRPACQ